MLPIVRKSKVLLQTTQHRFYSAVSNKTKTPSIKVNDVYSKENDPMKDFTAAQVESIKIDLKSKTKNTFRLIQLAVGGTLVSLSGALYYFGQEQD
jgi:flagellar biosynthesis protein FliP